MDYIDAKLTRKLSTYEVLYVVFLGSFFKFKGVWCDILYFDGGWSGLLSVNRVQFLTYGDQYMIEDVPCIIIIPIWFTQKIRVNSCRLSSFFQSVLFGLHVFRQHETQQCGIPRNQNCKPTKQLFFISWKVDQNIQYVYICAYLCFTEASGSFRAQCFSDCVV